VASVGEAEAAAPLLSELRARGISVVATAQTVAGRETLRRCVPGVRARLCALDVGPLVRGSLAAVEPRVVALVETELWPGLILEARRRGCAVVVVSGRISDRSLPRYRLARPLVARVLRSLHTVAARSEEDARRFVELGAPAERVRVVGDLKLDRPAPPPASHDLLGAIGPGPILLAGSTHGEEEEILLEAWSRLRANAASKLRLVLAPRHVERAARVLACARERGAEAELRTGGAASADVAVLDTIGELASLYASADLVFVGGSLVPVGGHNLLEPVRAGRVLVHGPHLANQRAQAELLAPLGVLHSAESLEQLVAVLGRLWSDPDRHAPARRAVAALERHRGASRRSAELIVEALRRGGRDA
jgi:3-deoxy-D-manno-octulosonic-acid transferase